MSRGAPWIAWLAAIFAGLAAGLAHPPFGVLPGLLGYALLLHLLSRTPLSRRGAFLRGWLAGVGYFAVSVWWVVEPFMVDAANQGWMAPFALVLMAAGLALFWGVAGLVYRLADTGGWRRPVVFAGLFALLEWLRGNILTGFPWNLPGESWLAGSAPSQAAAVVGAYGLTWITLLLAATPALAVAATPRGRMAVAAAVIAGLAGLYGLGVWRLASTPPSAAGAPTIRIVQANIDQTEKWKPENLGMVFDTYVEMTRRPAKARPDVVIWPEGALPAVIDDLVAPGSPYGPRLRDAVAPGQSLIMGANRADVGEDGLPAYFNSLLVFRRDAPPGGALRVTAIYDKHRLVPFGEFLPLGDLAGRLGIRSLVHMPEDFTAGPPPQPLTPDGLPAFQPLICYEALFPGFTRKAALRAGARPAWILNISNDAWFGVTSGPRQHLNIASYRAIEEGLPIVRATPTGVSAVIDAHGRIATGAHLGLGAQGLIDARLPAALTPTPYARFGELFFILMLAASMSVWATYPVRRP